MPKTITISTPAQLTAALATAGGGDTILLEGGDYGRFTLSKTDFPTNVTIASADPGDPAVFSGMALSKVSNLTFDGITFDYTFQAGDLSRIRPFEVSDSSHVTIRNSTFDGDLAHGRSSVDDGYGTGYALYVRGCESIVVENNEFFDFARGAIFNNTSGLTVQGNDLHGMSSDGMNFSQVQDVLIEGNFMHDFVRSPESTAHPDMIQFWTNGTDAPSGNIIIRGNRLDIGDGAWTQSIFMRNERVDSQGAGKDMYYYNILIEDNVIANNHLHGITVGETDGLTIRNNTVVHAPGRDAGAIISGINLPSIRVATQSKDVTVTDNIATKLVGHEDQPGWKVAGNLLLSPADYEDAFVTSTISPNDGIHEFRARPDGEIALSGAGAAETLDTRPADLTAQFDAIIAEKSLSTWTFDASASVAGGADFPPGTVFLWEFGDGAVASGRVVNHSYTDDGHYEASLTIQLPDGRVETARHSVTAESVQVLEMKHGSGFVIHDPGIETTLDNAAIKAQGLVIGAPGVTASIGKRHVAELIDSASFGIDLSLKAASATSTGEVFRLHGSMVASVTDKGELFVQTTTAAGIVKVTTTGAGLTDRAVHDIRIDYAEDRISITVDGKVLAAASMPEPLVGGSHDLSFGNPWGKANFAGTITDFAIDRGALALPEFSETKVLDSTWAGDGSIPPVLDTPELPKPDVDDAPAELVPPAEPPKSEPPVPAPILLELGNPGVAHRIERASVVDMLEKDAFSVNLGIQADSVESRGEVFRLHQSIVTSVIGTGEIVVRAFTAEGVIRLETKGASLDDLDPHQIGVTLADGVLSISVDGAINVSTAMTSPLANEGRHDLTFGNPWGKQNFDGVLTDFKLGFPVPDGSGGEVWTSVGLGSDMMFAGAHAAGTPVVPFAEPAAVAEVAEGASGGFFFGRFGVGPVEDAVPEIDHMASMDRFGFLAHYDSHIPQI